MSERLDKLEANAESALDFDDTTVVVPVTLVREIITQLEEENAALKQALTLIGDIGYDYDGYGKVDSLKELIDEMVGYARNPQSAVDVFTAEEQEDA